ncbi:MAG TPA: CbtB domain-containing protein [Usitatibacter sp.]|nr:CbtB domain-containing protein [Usitatibacter sp.]
MTFNARSVPATPESVDSAEGSIAAIAAALIGALLIYLAGFASMEALHNGAHDARHAAGLPCH